MKVNCKNCKKEFNLAPSAIKAGRKCCSFDCSLKIKWSNPDYRKHMSEVHKGISENIEKLVAYNKSPKAKKIVSDRFKGKPAWNRGLKFPEWSGEHNWRWIKDRTKLQKSERSLTDSASNYWRKQVKLRDGNKCKIANKDCNGQLEVHHILTWKDYPELRYDINNGITLCHFHHPRKEVEVISLSPFFQKLVTNNN